MRKLKSYRHHWEGNSLVKWYLIRNPLRVIANFVVIYVCRYLPSLALKRFLYRRIGMKVGDKVSIGLGAVFDIFFPDKIEIGDNSIIGFNSVILCHEFLIEEWRNGKVSIGKGVMIGSNVTILPGVEIGDNAIISSMSLVNRDVSKGERVGGVPIRGLKDESD